MDDKKQPKTPAQDPNAKVIPPKRPNEVGSFQIDGFVKIFDPNTKEVFVEKRA